ncbi:MAG: cysteine desulfurase NifS [Terrimicrobiaceae bacterium]|nr:cysteine desulfurase NifS [Terrimicrobiaceae bacterium]
MSEERILYFDYNATTQIDPAVVEEMLPWLRDCYGNPSSAYRFGKRALQAVEVARERVAALLGCEPSEIVFTSCGSESINTAIQSALAADPDRTHVITSGVEHSATMKLCEHLARRGCEVTWLPVDSEGRLDPARLEKAIRPDTALVSLLWANNETGVLFPVERIAEICRAKKVLFHCDAVQAVGKIPLHLADAGIHFLSVSGHKLHCPKGVGVLYVNKRVRFTPWLRGSQEGGRRGGTQNVASIVALGRAAEIAAQNLAEEQTRVRELRDRFESEILACVTGVEVNGDREHRLPNTTSLAFEGLEAEGALILLDERGVCCSAGSACTSGSVHPSHVLKAMGFSNERARASLRFSFGRFNTEAEIDAGIEIVPAVVEKLRALSPVTGPVLVS